MRPSRFAAGMAELDRLHAQARRCRALAAGLSNHEDVRILELLAAEYEARAREIDNAARSRSPVLG